MLLILFGGVVFCTGLCVIICASLFFFCFKRKTAYEMRISDWSSDVCSSDLAAVAVALDRAAQDRVAVGLGHVDAERRGRAPALLDFQDFDRTGIGVEIGRASCRERVCQYV